MLPKFQFCMLSIISAKVFVKCNTIGVINVGTCLLTLLTGACSFYS